MSSRSQHRVVRIAVLIGAVAILACFGLAYWAYGQSAAALTDTIAQNNLSLARRLGNHALQHHSTANETAAPLEQLTRFWNETEALYEGSFLCVVDSTGSIVLHSSDPQAIGQTVENARVHFAEDHTLSVPELIRRGEDWAGTNRSASGLDQIVGYAYFSDFDGILAVHTPMELVIEDLRAAAVPWAVGVFIIGGFLIPLLVILLHRSYSSAHRSFLETELRRKQLEEQLRQTQKMEAVGRLAGGVAHDFNNLLTALFGNVDLARQDLQGIPGESPIMKRLDDIESTADRASMLTRQLLAFSRKQDLELQTLNLNQLVDRTHGMLGRLIGDNIRLELELGRNVPNVHGDAGWLEQILLNLALNSRDSMPDGGLLRIETSSVDLVSTGVPGTATGLHGEIKVTDNGCGMSEKVVERIFDPFYTTKPVGEGTGLGLSTVFNIVQKLGGRVLVRSEPGSGTCMTIQLPASSGDVVTEEAPLAASAGNGETVLVCEDDEDVRRLTANSLELAGYQVLVADCGKDALALARAAQRPIELLVTDVMLPDVDGRTVARTLQAEFPELPVLFISGYTGEPDADPSMDWTEVQLLNKPFKSATLLHRVGSALAPSSSA